MNEPEQTPPRSPLEVSWLRRGGRQVPGPSDGTGSRLLIAGDTHGNLDWIRSLTKLAARRGCSGVVQLGDFGFWPDQRVMRNQERLVINDRWLDEVANSAAQHGVWWRVVDGNHDAHPLARAAYPSNENGVRPIRDGVLDWADRGSVWTWCGVRFGALGGAVSIDKDVRVEGISWWATEYITDDEVQSLTNRAGANGVDVLLTHDAPVLPPGIRSLDNYVVTARCARSIEQIAAAVQRTAPSLLMHGHYHMRYTALHEQTRIEGLASDEERGTFAASWAILDTASLQVHTG